MEKNHLSRIKVEGFKSLAECDLGLNNLNVLIGANGAGKSNFLSFFGLMGALIDNHLQKYVSKAGGPDALLHFGRKKTAMLRAELHFGKAGYKLALEPTNDNRMMFAQEEIWGSSEPGADMRSGHFETDIKFAKFICDSYYEVRPRIRAWRTYHFHDTSDSARVKQLHSLSDNLYLRSDASNLAAYLLYLKESHTEHFHRIQKTISLVAPFFGEFLLRSDNGSPESIELEWFEEGEDMPFKAHHLSDGTLRFICLATLLLQPAEKQAETIIIDEPELGLHPYAITVLAGLLKSASKEKQIIVSTQSVDLLSEFSPEDVIVVDRAGNRSVLSRLDSNSLQSWLEEYSLGELWKKNLLGGRPS